MRDKKGLSAIVMTVIMVGLVLVAVGIVWVVVLNILEGQSESIDYQQKCIGFNFDVAAASCTSGTCTVQVERKSGSVGDPIDGAELTVKQGSNSKTQNWTSDIVSETISVTGTTLDDGAADATLRLYFLKEDGTKHYCSQIFNSP